MLRRKYERIEYSGSVDRKRRPKLGSAIYQLPESAREQFRHRPYTLKGDQEHAG